MSKKEFLFITSILLLALFSFTARATFAPFNIEDDYHYVKIAQSDLGYFDRYENRSTFDSFSNYFKKYNAESGRFRPLSVGALWVYSKLALGDSRISGGLIFLTAFLLLFTFYLLLRKLNVSILIALIFTLIFLTGKNEQIFYRRTGELFGMICLFSGSLFFLHWIRTSKKIPFVFSLLFLLASAFFKETFGALLPIYILLATVYVMHSQNLNLTTAFFKLNFFNLSLILGFLVAILGVAMALQHQTTYSVHTSIDLEPDRMLKNILAMLGSPLLFFSILLGMFVFWKEIISKPNMKYFFLIGIGWMSVQLFIYKNVSVEYNRYLMPGMLIPLIASALFLEKLKSSNIKFVYTIPLIAAGFALMIGMKNVIINTSHYHARATSYNDMLDFLKDAKPSNQSQIGMMMEEGGLYDFFESTAVFLSKRKVDNALYLFERKKNKTVKVYSLKELIQSSETIHSSGARPEEMFFQSLLENKKLDYIIVAKPITIEEPEPIELLEKMYDRIYFEEKYFNTSWFELLKLDIKYETLSYMLLIKKNPN